MHLYMEKYTCTQIQNRDGSIKRFLHASTHRDRGICIERDTFIEKRDVFYIDPEREAERKQFSRHAFLCRSIYLPTETQA